MGTDSTIAKNPTRALFLSFIPGGGQLYNGNPLKAGLFAGAFGYFTWKYLSAETDYQANPESTELHRTRNDYIWLLGLTWTLNIIDAYVDAQFWDFEQYELNDEVLPDSIQIISPKMETLDDGK